nr:hypothetical transcript [Hymenolepis microstoma]
MTIFEGHKLLMFFQRGIQKRYGTNNPPPKGLKLLDRMDFCFPDEHFLTPQPWVSLSNFRGLSLRCFVSPGGTHENSHNILLNVQICERMYISISFDSISQLHKPGAFSNALKN